MDRENFTFTSSDTLTHGLKVWHVCRINIPLMR